MTQVALITLEGTLSFAPGGGLILRDEDGKVHPLAFHPSAVAQVGKHVIIAARADRRGRLIVKEIAPIAKR